MVGSPVVLFSTGEAEVCLEAAKVTPLGGFYSFGSETLGCASWFAEGIADVVPQIAIRGCATGPDGEQVIPLSE